MSKARSEYSYSRVQLALGIQLNSRLFKLSCELCDFANLGDGARTKLGAPEPEPNSGRRCPNQTPRGADTRGVAGHDAREVEVDSDGEVDARDDLDALAVLAVEHVEKVVVLLLVLGQPPGYLRSDRSLDLKRCSRIV
jgi:hypothetical protein